MKALRWMYGPTNKSGFWGGMTTGIGANTLSGLADKREK